MKTVFLLQHSYEEEDEDGIMSEYTKTLGIYSTEEKAEQAVQFYKPLPGFKNYPDDCFHVEEYDLNRNEWDTGFVTAEGFYEREEPKTPEEVEYVIGCIKNRIQENQEELKKFQEDLKKYTDILTSNSGG